MDELDTLIAEFEALDTKQGGTNQDEDIRWGELCHRLTPMLVKTLKEAQEVVIEADSMYNNPPKRQEYDVAKYTLRTLASTGWKRIEEVEELRQKLKSVTKERDVARITIKYASGALGCDPDDIIEVSGKSRTDIKDAAAVLGCAPSDLVAMAKETVDDKRKLERENDQLASVLRGAGFEPFREGDRAGMKQGSQMYYFAEDES